MTGGPVADGAPVTEVAQLNADLLARKGGAAPAVRRPDDAVVMRWPARAEHDGARRYPEPRSDGTGLSAKERTTRLKFTLRLDLERHRRIRLAAAHAGISMQAFALRALDAYVADAARSVATGPCACLDIRRTGPDRDEEPT